MNSKNDHLSTSHVLTKQDNTFSQPTFVAFCFTRAKKHLFVFAIGTGISYCLWVSKRMRKSLLPPRTPSSSKNANGEGGRCTEFVALIDHADLVDTSSFNFTEHVNRDGARVFELNNPVGAHV